MKALLGNSPWTSVLGYVIAGLQLWQEYIKAGETNYFVIASAILVAILGRVVKGEDVTTEK